MNYQKAVTFSYDDGVTQDRRLVRLFNRYGMKATFNLNTGLQSEESRFTVEGMPVCRMNQEGLKELYRGHEIAVHGLTHTAAENMTETKLEREFLTDAKNIERLYGKYPVGMAYAYGCYDNNTIAYLKKIGIRYGRTVGSTHSFELPRNPLLLETTCHHDDDRLFELAEQFLSIEAEKGHPLLFSVWGHSYEFDINQNWDRMERLCHMLAGRSDIFYGTNAECLL